MASLISLPLRMPPETIRLRVEYYDAEEQTGIMRSIGKDVLGGTSRDILVPTQDFCAYYLFYKLREGAIGYNTYDRLASKWANALAELDGQVEFSNGSVRIAGGVVLNRATSERLGEAIGLSAVSTIHNLHAGDWSFIPETNTRKTLDFQIPIASDMEHVLLLEAKGSSTENNELKTSSVSNHRTSIKGKKSAALPTETSRSALYGTIGVVDNRPDSSARCWIVDPPYAIPDKPYNVKLINRLGYIARWISILGPRSSLAASLWTRIASLRKMEDLEPLNNVALRTAADSEYSKATFSPFGDHHPWFSSKCVVADGPAGGLVFPASKNVLLFLGIREELVALAAAQRFEAILDYSFASATLQKTVKCAVPRSTFRRKFYDIALPDREPIGRSGYVRFDLDGLLHYCKSGFIFGALQIPEKLETTG